MSGRVLTIAESDCSGGSGIQADIKTILALGGYATTAVTGISAQSTTTRGSFQMLDPLIVEEQIDMVLGDIGTDAIKTGVLNSEMVVDIVGAAVRKALAQNPGLPVVVDPSLVARGGELLVDESTVNAIKRNLLVHATVLTPNLKEAEHLTGMTLRDIDDMNHAASMMRTLGVTTVVLKAGQALGESELYLVAGEDGARVYERPKVNTPHTLGAGCTLSSAIAVSLAQGLPMQAAIERALDFLHQAILHAPGYGAGCGPMNHAFSIERQGAFFHPESIKMHKV